MHSLSHISFKVAAHTDNVGPGTIFVAIHGTKQDGTQYIAQAINKGASQIVIDHNAILSDSLLQQITDAQVQITRVANTRASLAQLAAKAYDFPAKRLKIIGITGTKGKTTSTFLAHHILQEAGYKTAMLTGVYNAIGNQQYNASLTTPQPDYLHHFFALCIEQGIEYVVMEAAAQALSLHRLDGINFTGVIFTNFSQEHGEFYSSLAEYFAAKQKIITQVTSSGIVCLNADEPWLQEIITPNPHYVTFGRNPQAQFHLLQSHADMHAIAMTIEHTIHSYHFMSECLVGSFNVYNILGVIACLHSLGLSFGVIDAALQNFTGVPGRLERYMLANEVVGIIDYAHNPSSFNALLSTLRDATQQLIVVFGCGGERDATKRPIMGGIVDRYADMIVLTADNPRSEQVEQIMDDIAVGIAHKDKIVQEPDRAQAIATAYAQATPGAIIAILGKGPESYQEIAGIKYPWSDKEQLQRYIKKV